VKKSAEAVIFIKKVLKCWRYK